jgi:hypothetical protein
MANPAIAGRRLPPCLGSSIVEHLCASAAAQGDGPSQRAGLFASHLTVTPDRDR